jgi:beta-hydroxylase
MFNAKKISNRHEKFPLLCQLLDKIPGIVSAFFSWLKPNTVISEHEGYENYAEKILRYHLGIIVPKGDIALKCNKIVKSWQNGKSFIFDDSLPHGAWNKSKFDRYVLIVDFIKDDKESIEDLKKIILTDEAKYFYDKYNNANDLTVQEKYNI